MPPGSCQFLFFLRNANQFPYLISVNSQHPSKATLFQFIDKIQRPIWGHTEDNEYSNHRHYISLEVRKTEECSSLGGGHEEIELGTLASQVL